MHDHKPHQPGEGDGVGVAVDLVEELQGRQGPHVVAPSIHGVNRVRDQTAVNRVVMHPQDLPVGKREPRCKLLRTILDDVEVYAKPVSRTKKVPHYAVEFMADEENITVYESL